jgi:hypothetical protein
MLLLKWDYIDIRNRSNRHHDIKDMYVGLPIKRKGGGFTNSIHGFRGKLSPIEYAAGYRHSHLYSGSNYINPFCTGSDGINDLWADLSMSDYQSDKDFDIKLEGFIHQLTAFLSYESLEGVPYFRMENINTGRTNNISSRHVNGSTAAILRNLSISDIELCMDFNSGTALVMETEHLHNIMAMFATKHQKRLPNGTYVNLSAEEMASTDGWYIDEAYTEFNFMGSSHKIFVEPHFIEKKSNGEEERKYAHQQIVQSVIGKLEQFGEEVLGSFCLENSIPVEAKAKGTDNDWGTVDSRHYVRVSETTLEGVERSAILATERGSGSGESVDISF